MPLPTMLPSPTSNPWSTFPKIRNESPREFYKPKEELKDQQKLQDHDQQFYKLETGPENRSNPLKFHEESRQKQGLPIIIEQEEPELASFEVGPSDKDQKTWNGSVRPLAQSSDSLASNGDEFKALWPKNGKENGQGKQGTLKNNNQKHRDENSSSEDGGDETRWTPNEGKRKKF